MQHRSLAYKFSEVEVERLAIIYVNDISLESNRCEFEETITASFDAILSCKDIG